MLSLVGIETCLIYWNITTSDFDIVACPFECQPKSFNLAALMLLNRSELVSRDPIANTWFICDIVLCIEPHGRFQWQSGTMTQFALRRLFPGGEGDDDSFYLECCRSKSFDQDNKAFHSVQNSTGHTKVLVYFLASIVFEI